MRLNEKEAIYAAGFFDGEGCVQIGPGGHSPFILWVRITNTDLSVLKWFSERLGGSINVQTPPKNGRIKQAKPCWFWRLYSANAASFLETILPYMIVKLEQARLAVEFQKRVVNGTNNVSDEEICIRRSYALRISELNSGVGYQQENPLRERGLLAESDYLYAAGILDGEGYILINKAKRSHWLGVRVTNTNRSLIEKLKAQFGGGIAKKPDGRARDCWDWSTVGKGAAAFLVKVFPYLIVKKEQARMGLEFQDAHRRLIESKAPMTERIALGDRYKAKISESIHAVDRQVTAAP